jgi:hypothetical protein
MVTSFLPAVVRISDGSDDGRSDNRLSSVIVREKHFYRNRELCEVLTGYLLLGRLPAGDWANT